jgi:hypothetical protein
MTMWTLDGDVEEAVSDLPDIELPNKRRRSRRRAWRDGLADQTVAKSFEDIRAYRALERALIGSVDPRSAIELALVHRLANLLWRLRRASAVETGLLEIQGEPLLARRQDPSGGPSQPRALPTPREPMAMARSLARTGHTSRRSATEKRCQHPCVHRSPSLNDFCAFRILTPPRLTAWAGTKRDFGVKRRKQSGRLTR